MSAEGAEGAESYGGMRDLEGWARGMKVLLRWGRSMFMEFEDITEKIIGSFYEVYRVLGSGFLEKVYENALGFEFVERGLGFGGQVLIRVEYKGRIAGDYFADFIVEDEVVVEVKAKDCLCGVDEMQLLNYLKASGKRVGLLVNFGGKRLEFKRMVLGARD
jgi:GxxExxY protein